jgi:TP901 family phage tail tape measure protein
MADITRTIEIIFGAVDRTGAGIQSAADGLSSFANSSQTLAEPLAEVADYAVKAEAALVSLAGVYGGYALVKAAEFQSSQIDLAKVLAATDPQIEEFTDEVKRLSETYGVAATDVLQGIANFKQSGFTAAEAAKLQKDALDLVIAGDIDAAKASDILVTSLKGFGAEASSAGRFIEALNNVSNDYATDVAQLAEGVSRVSPIMKTMGFSFEESTGLITPIIEVFRTGGEAADALKTGLLKLLDDSKPVAESMKALGVSQTDLNGNMRSGREIFYDVAKAFETLDQNQKLVFASQLFGIEQAPKLVTVFDNLGKVNEITAAAMQQTGSAAKEVELRLQSTAKQADIFKSSFDNLAISIGQQLNGQFGGIVEGASDVAQALRQIVDQGALEPFLLAMRPVLQDFAETLQNVAKNLPAAFEQIDFSGLLFSFKNLGFEIDQIFDGLDLNTVDGLAEAIQFVVDSFASLTNVVSGIVDAWGPVIKAFVAGVDAFNSLDAGSQKAAGTLTGISQIVRDLSGSVTQGADALEVIGKAMQAIAGISAVQSLTSFIGGLSSAGAASGAAASAMGILSTAIKALPLIGLAVAATDAASALASGERSSLSGALDWVVSKLTDSDNLGDFFFDMTHGSEAAAERVQELEINVQKLRNATGDTSVNIENYRQKLAEFAESTAKAAEEHNRLGANIDTSKTDFTDLNSVIKLSRQVTDDWSSGIVHSTQQLFALSGVVGEASGEMLTLNGGVGMTADEFEAFAGSAELLKSAVKSTGEAAGQAVTAFDTLAEAESYLLTLGDDVKQKYITFEEGLYKVTAVGDKAQDSFQTLAEAENYLLNVTDNASSKYISFENGVYKIIDTGFRASESTHKLATATEKAAEAAKVGSEEWKRVQDVLIESQKQANEFALGMEKLSNERFQIEVQAAVDLKTAEIEAGTQRIQAAFEATTETIRTLTTGVTDLWSVFAQGNGSSPGKGALLFDAAMRMEERLDAELELKRQMTEAVVAQATATTQRLASGEPLISIDAGNLAPELEMIFDKILRYTQIKATQQGLSLLVGI